VPDLGNLPALDVAIGLAFLFFLLSTVCSGINEGIASFLGWRAKTLEDAVGNLLAHGEWKEERDDKAHHRDLATELFEHWRVKAAMESLPEGQARALVYKAAINADGTLEGFRRQVETGFDDAMERASGWYKRKVQFTVVVLAALLTFGLNVDSVRIGSRLWSDKPVRTAVAAKAAAASDSQKAADAVDTVDQLKLPLGWGANNAPDSVGSALRRIPGWLISIAALSLGASFWFDLLSRVARLRGSGVPKEPRSMSDTAGASDDR
jgi:hypothetical protein